MSRYLTLRNALTVAVMAALSGCVNLAPDYQRPDSPVSQNWPSGVSTPRGADARADRLAADIGWRDYFVDERLQRTIEAALANNRDLRVAALNVEMARAQYRIQRADQLPTINGVVQENAQRLPGDLRGVSPSISRQYTVGLSISSYEVDFWSRVQNLKRQALEEYLASEEGRRSAQISLVAEVANAWLSLAADRELLQLAKNTSASQQQSYDLVRRRFSVGVASDLDVSQARSSVETAKLDVARYTAQVAEDENALRLLVGKELSPELLPAKGLPTQAVLRGVPVGVDSDVLLQRPDILRAEHLLKGANANIGAARAAFFPSITLTANGGTSSDQLDRLFRSGSGLWGFAPQISIPIFDTGRNRATLDVAKLQRDINIAQYEKAIQSAFREVSDALAQRNTIGDRMMAQTALVETNGKSYRLSTARFKAGVDSYLNVLDSQRSLYGAQQGLIGTRLAQQANLVSLYKVLGGGWREHNADCQNCPQPVSDARK